MAPRAPRRLPRAPQERPKRAPGGPKRRPKGLQEAPKKPPRGNNPSKTYGEIHAFCFLVFSLPMAIEASRWLQDGPRGPQERPKRAPRRPQERPRALQERLKRGPRGDSRHSRGAALIKAPPSLIYLLQDGPKSASKAPKSAPRGPQEAPRGAQDASKRLPRDPHEAPRGAHEASKTLPRDPQEAKILPKHMENPCFWLSRFFGFDGHPRPQDGSEMAQEGPKRGPREP